MTPGMSRKSIAGIMPLWKLSLAEPIYAEKNSTAVEIYSGIFVYIEVFYNRIRRYSTLGYKLPALF